MLLINKPNNTLSYYGRKLTLDLAYDTVLRVFKLFKEDLFSDTEKINIALEMFITNYKYIEKYSYEKKTDILKTIFAEFINTKEKNKSNSKKTFDFFQDADFIYASFFQAYHIDLIEQQGKMSWQKFIALFQGLPADTKICEVISIRMREIPEATKYNAKEIQALNEAKRMYALKAETCDSESSFQEDINRFGAMLIQSAVTKER